MKTMLQCGHQIPADQLEATMNPDVRLGRCERCNAWKYTRKLMLKGEELIEAAFKAVREDKKLGVGSCSTVDECMTDDELKSAIRELCKDVKNPSVAIVLRELKAIERIRNERAREVRSEAW